MSAVLGWRGGRGEHPLQRCSVMWMSLAMPGREFGRACLWQICLSHGKMWLAALESQSTVWSQGSWGASSAPHPPGAIWGRTALRHPPAEDVFVHGWAPLACSSGWVPAGLLIEAFICKHWQGTNQAPYFNLLNNFWLFFFPMKTEGLGFSSLENIPPMCLFCLAVKSCSRITRTNRLTACWQLVRLKWSKPPVTII